VAASWPGRISLAQAQGPFDDLTPNQYTFDGRRGTGYTATWDSSTYEITIATPDGNFPWDWISFVGTDGAISLAGYDDIEHIFCCSNPGSISGAEAGDIIRVKARDIHNLAHLTKIGLVIGSGPSAQRAWLSDGLITEYRLAPHYVGYTAQVLGRQVTVRLSSLSPGDFQAVGVIEVTLDDPTNARLVLASDLEPALDWRYGVEFRDTSDTLLSFDSSAQAVVGLAVLDTEDEQQYGQPLPVYLYSSAPLQSWSANNLTFDAYLNADTLDGQIASGANDGRSALSVVAAPVQYFYIGSTLLDDATRADPTAAMEAIRSVRLGALAQLPLVDAPAIPGLKLVNVVSNLLNAYLINPGGKVYAVDKVVIYAPDTLIPINTAPHLLPDYWLDAFADMLAQFGQYQYQGGDGEYWWKMDGDAGPVPDWYGGNIADVYYFLPDGQLARRWQFSDAYSTAEWISGLANLYRVRGNLSFLQARETEFDAALAALQRFDGEYDATFGQDGNLFPNLLVPMGDLSRIQGEYPAETGQTILAYEDAADILDLLGRGAEAANLWIGYVNPMKAAFDAFFWNGAWGYYLPKGDQRSQTKSPGEWYTDKWCQTMIPPLGNDVGDTHLADMLTTYTAGGFYEPAGDVHWLSTDSENFPWPGRWGLNPNYTNGFIMQGGFFVGLPPVFPPVGYYQLGQINQGDQYANIYADRWLDMGPYETMNEWQGTVPGRFLESSMYIEPTFATTWLLQEALGLEVEGTTVTIAPLWNDPFVVRNLHITSQGLTAVVDYARDDQGQETINIVSNDGLTIVTPHIGGPAIAIAKDPDTQAVLSGGTASFTITITNTGDVTLDNVTVSDPQASDCEASLGSLAAGDSVSYPCSQPNVTADFINSATVTGTPPVGNDVSDTDTATVNVVHPAIAIAKTPNTQTVAGGDAASFTITVTNTGDVTLDNVTVGDPQASDCEASLGSLAAGSSVSYSCSQPNVTADFINSATVTGTPPVGGEVMDVDTAVVVTEEAVAGLTAINNGPTSLGMTTVLTAFITAGSNVTYTWALGDGVTYNGAVASHIYPAVGTYTAVVTASNPVSLLTATTTVTITADSAPNHHLLYLPAILK